VPTQLIDHPAVRRSAHGFLSGLREPLDVLRKARAAGFGPDYARYVVRQAVVVALSMLVVGGLFIGNIQLADDERAGFFAQHFPSLFSLWVKIVALYGAWLIVEWIVAFLWKEHGEVLADELARAIGVPPDAPPVAVQLGRPPRVRIDFGYLRLKLRRLIHNGLMYASGAPFFIAALAIPRVGDILGNVLLAAWTAYWWFVTTAAKSELAWRDPPSGAPWFIRAWDTLTENVPGFRWFLPRWYGRVWRRVTRRLHPAALLVEDAPAELAGLSGARLIGELPLLSIAVRPLLPVCATAVATRGQNVGAPVVA
jgi:hypothetical protein